MAEEPEPWHPESVGPPRLTMLESWSQRQVEHLASEDPQEEANDAEKDTSGGEPTNEKVLFKTRTTTPQKPMETGKDSRWMGSGRRARKKRGRRHRNEELFQVMSSKRRLNRSSEQETPGACQPHAGRGTYFSDGCVSGLQCSSVIATSPSTPTSTPSDAAGLDSDWETCTNAKGKGRKGCEAWRQEGSQSPNSKSPAASTAAPRRGRARSAPQGRSSRGSSMNARQRGSTASVAGNVLAPAGQQGSPNTGRTDHFNVVVGEMMGRLQSVERRLFMIESQNRRFRQRLSDLEYEEELRTDGSAGHTSMMAGYHMESADASFEDDEGGALPEEDGNGLSW
eukprot:CAMPEP_0168860764 /NCGR_PEP_ID=MMETSP0727-20121128/17559_1 /TAXON_ID=265536 /ORGANISM="Amphiprora sp., Strain CCMP467" /LENGTH=338 /DNA_ID=CAMNT_0008915725 /DNA_START=44 /DNA_END=1061 /DNA_ORIENTATION=+